MTQTTVVLEWADDLGPRWMNQGNLASLLTTKVWVDPHILSIVSVTFNDFTAKEWVQADLDALVCKRTSLCKFLNTKAFVNLDEYAQELLRKQYTIMTDYHIVLAERIAAW